VIDEEMMRAAQKHSEEGHWDLEAINPITPHANPDLRSNQLEAVQQQQPPSPAHTIPYKPEGETSPNTVLLSNTQANLSDSKKTFAEPKKSGHIPQPNIAVQSTAMPPLAALKLDKEVIDIETALTWGPEPVKTANMKQAGIEEKVTGQSGDASPAGPSPTTATAASSDCMAGGKKKTRQ
jgi:hypothetical protein